MPHPCPSFVFAQACWVLLFRCSSEAFVGHYELLLVAIALLACFSHASVHNFTPLASSATATKGHALHAAVTTWANGEAHALWQEFQSTRGSRVAPPD